MEKTCANLPCSAKFEPNRASQKYCCVKCRSAALARAINAKSEEHKKAHALSGELWKLNNPDKVKAIRERARKKQYKAGKLPKWMFS